MYNNVSHFKSIIHQACILSLNTLGKLPYLDKCYYYQLKLDILSVQAKAKQSLKKRSISYLETELIRIITIGKLINYKKLEFSKLNKQNIFSLSLPFILYKYYKKSVNNIINHACKEIKQSQNKDKIISLYTTCINSIKALMTKISISKINKNRLQRIYRPTVNTTSIKKLNNLTNTACKLVRHLESSHEQEILDGKIHNIYEKTKNRLNLNRKHNHRILSKAVKHFSSINSTIINDIFLQHFNIFIKGQSRKLYKYPYLSSNQVRTFNWVLNYYYYQLIYIINHSIDKNLNLKIMFLSVKYLNILVKQAFILSHKKKLIINVIKQNVRKSYKQIISINKLSLNDKHQIILLLKQITNKAYLEIKKKSYSSQLEFSKNDILGKINRTTGKIISAQIISIALSHAYKYIAASTLLDSYQKRIALKEIHMIISQGVKDIEKKSKLKMTTNKQRFNNKSNSSNMNKLSGIVKELKTQFSHML